MTRFDQHVALPPLPGSPAERPPGWPPRRPDFPPEYPGPTPPSRLPVGPSAMVAYPDGGGNWWEERLFDQRVLMATGRLDRERATALSAKLLTLDALDGDPITVRLDSEGADLDAVWSLVDTLDQLAAPVHVHVVGEVGGGSLALLTGVAERRSFPHARFRLAEPRLPHLAGTAEKIAGEFAGQQRLLDAFRARLAESTGRPLDDLTEDLRRGRFLTAPQAVEYGLVTGLVS